jgi:hypothetical protein
MVCKNRAGLIDDMQKQSRLDKWYVKTEQA